MGLDAFQLFQCRGGFGQYENYLFLFRFRKINHKNHLSLMQVWRIDLWVCLHFFCRYWFILMLCFLTSYCNLFLPRKLSILSRFSNFPYKALYGIILQLKKIVSAAEVITHLVSYNYSFLHILFSSSNCCDFVHFLNHFFCFSIIVNIQ